MSRKPPKTIAALVKPPAVRDDPPAARANRQHSISGTSIPAPSNTELAASLRDAKKRHTGTEAFPRRHTPAYETRILAMTDGGGPEMGRRLAAAYAHYGWRVYVDAMSLWLERLDNLTHPARGVYRNHSARDITGAFDVAGFFPALPDDPTYALDYASDVVRRETFPDELARQERFEALLAEARTYEEAIRVWRPALANAARALHHDGLTAARAVLATTPGARDDQPVTHAAAMILADAVDVITTRLHNALTAVQNSRKYTCNNPDHDHSND